MLHNKEALHCTLTTMRMRNLSPLCGSITLVIHQIWSFTCWKYALANRRIVPGCFSLLDLGCNDASQGITLSPMVDTDALNANIALLGLHLLCKHHPNSFPTLSLTSELTRAALDARPPCRWEEHTYTVRLPVQHNDMKISAEQLAAGLASRDDQVTSNNGEQNSVCSEKTVQKEVPVHVVLDMGHNPAAMGALARRMAHKFQGRNVRWVLLVFYYSGICCRFESNKLRMQSRVCFTRLLAFLSLMIFYWVSKMSFYRVVYAMSRDKDVRTCLKNVLSVVPSSHVHFVQVRIKLFSSVSFTLFFSQKHQLIVTFCAFYTAVQELSCNLARRALSTVPRRDRWRNVWFSNSQSRYCLSFPFVFFKYCSLLYAGLIA